VKPRDPLLLRDVAVVLLDCGLRPEEYFRLRWDEVRDGALRITHGKTANARRVVPMQDRAMGIVEMRRGAALRAEWVFPAETRSGHVEASTLKKPHRKACALAGVDYFPLYRPRSDGASAEGLGWAQFWAQRPTGATAPSVERLTIN